MVPITYYYALAIALFLCGIIGLLVRRSLIFMLMAIELMLNGVNLVFVAASKQWGNLDGQVMTFFVITVAACEAAVGLAMVIALFRRHGTVDTDHFRILRG
jgi:NADH-quinone oxidoreductase subunit K